MVEESKTFGSIECDQLVRKRFARQSGVENLKNDKFKELFPGSCYFESSRDTITSYVATILPDISDLTKEIKEGILEHKTKLESRLEKKEEAKVM